MIKKLSIIRDLAPEDEKRVAITKEELIKIRAVLMK